MNQTLFSVVIPAANEAETIQRAIESVQAQGRADCEVIVVVNGSHDDTASISERLGARVAVFPELLGSSLARNEGASLAQGSILVFLDADSYMGPGVLAALERAAAKNILGTVVGAPDDTAVRYRIFFAWKNAIHRLGLFRGVLGGLLFFDAGLFRAIGGYDPDIMVNEHAEIISRAMKRGGAYRYVRDATAYTSMRRFAEQGMLKVFFFWCFVQLFFRSRKTKTRLGGAYAASHDQLFEIEERQMGVSLASFALSSIGTVCGALILFASYYGPTAFVLDVFAEELREDPSTPMIDTMLFVAAEARLHTLILFGLTLLFVSALFLVRSARDVRELVAEELSAAK